MDGILKTYDSGSYFRMNVKLHNWIKENMNKNLESPRSYVFKRGRKPQEFKVIELNELLQRIKIEFQKNRTILPIKFWRFDQAIKFLSKKRDFVRLGTRLYADDLDTLEGHLQGHGMKRHNRKTDTKTAPHVGDLLVLTGLAEYGWMKNPYSGRRNQAIKLIRKNS